MVKKFKAITLSYWVVAVCDTMAPGVSVSVVKAINFLCQAFVQFEWNKWKVAVSATGAIGICKNDVFGHAAIMLENGMVNSTQNVTLQHLETCKTNMC